MSEDTKEYFNFGTRFPYTTKSQENGWVEILETQDTIDATKVYEYGDDNPLQNNNDGSDFVSFTVDSYGDDAKTIKIEKVRNEIRKKYELNLTGEIRWQYPGLNGGIVDGVANLVGKSKSDRWVATSGNANTSGIPAAYGMTFSHNGEDITTKVREVIDTYIKFNENNTPEIKLESENIREKKTERPRNNGEGKYLDLRVLYNTSVNKILGILSKNRKRKDLLFYEAMSWKSVPNSENTEKYYSTAASNFKEDIDESVQLIPENFIFRSGIKYDLGLSSEVTNSGPFKAINNLAGGGAMLDAIIKAAKKKDDVSFNFSERVDRFRNVPYVKDVDNSSIDSLTFKFQFGQFGLFSCEKEVVLPILKLASLFSYSFTGYEFEDKKQNGGDYRNNGNNWVKAPFEPKFTVMTKMYASLFNRGKFLINNLLSEDNNSTEGDRTPATPKINNLSQVPKLFSNIVNEAAGEARVTAFLFSIGSSIYGPFYASDVKWEFDYERTDNNGLPFSGTINFSGIKPLLVEDNIGLLSTGGQIIGDING